MKRFLEKVKDILYGSIDYMIMLSIIVAVVLIIGWRLDILFQKDVVASITGDNIRVEESNKPDSDKELDDDKSDEKTQNKLDSKDETEEEAEKDEDNRELEEIKNIKVNIPEGSFPAQIASILESNGLIEDSTDFIKKAVDLHLDTKLKSGVFDIPENASLEKMVKIIAKY